MAYMYLNNIGRDIGTAIAVGGNPMMYPLRKVVAAFRNVSPEVAVWEDGKNGYSFSLWSSNGTNGTNGETTQFYFELNKNIGDQWTTIKQTKGSSKHRPIYGYYDNRHYTTFVTIHDMAHLAGIDDYYQTREESGNHYVTPKGKALSVQEERNNSADDDLEYELSNDAKVLISILWAEASVGNEAERRAVTFSIINRSNMRGGIPVSEIIAMRAQYSGYQDKNYNYMMHYLNNRTYGDRQLEIMIQVVMDAYLGRTSDNSRGATSYYSPRSMPSGKAPYWWEIEKEVQIEGVRPNYFKFAKGIKPW